MRRGSLVRLDAGVLPAVEQQRPRLLLRRPRDSECTAPNTTKWSPPSCTDSTVQSMCASEPSMIGEPSFEGVQSIPANLSGSLEPNRAETSFWFSCRTLTQKLPLASIACQDRDALVGQNSTSGGSSDSAANDWQAKPDRHAVVHGGDDRDAGAELAEHVPERARVDRLRQIAVIAHAHRP